MGRKEECPHCSTDLHTCTHCSFYDTGSYNECREPQADVVKEKEKANFCDYFVWQGASGEKNNSNDLLSAAEDLFGKK